MADLSCASKQITQTDMEYDDLVQVDAGVLRRTLEPARLMRRHTIIF